jgi:hypothetical protein
MESIVFSFNGIIDLLSCQAERHMLKMLCLMVAGIVLATSGLYIISTAGFPALPSVNWATVGFVMIVGSVASFGTAFVTSRFK